MASPLVMRGLDPRIHDELQHAKPYCRSGGAASWIAGSSPAMTVGGQCALQIVKFTTAPVFGRLPAHDADVNFVLAPAFSSFSIKRSSVPLFSGVLASRGFSLSPLPLRIRPKASRHETSALEGSLSERVW